MLFQNFRVLKKFSKVIACPETTFESGIKVFNPKMVFKSQ